MASTNVSPTNSIFSPSPKGVVVGIRTPGVPDPAKAVKAPPPPIKNFAVPALQSFGGCCGLAYLAGFACSNLDKAEYIKEFKARYSTVRTGMIAVLTEHQKVPAEILLECGFKIIHSYINANSGNRLDVFISSPVTRKGQN